MDIAGLYRFSAENQYKTGAKSKLLEPAPSFVLDPEKEDKSPKSANSAQSAAKAVSFIGDQNTASTLWQTQAIAQSPESEAIDVETEDVSTKPKSAAEQFLDFMNKTPEELMREAILKELGYTEEQLASMGPKERALAEAKIQEAIKIKIEEALREDGINIDSANKAVLADHTLVSAS